jgi:hypothetical protein
MIGETLTLLLNSAAIPLIPLQKGGALAGKEALLCMLPGFICTFQGLICMLQGTMCGILYILFGGQEIITGLPEPISKFIEPFLSCSLFESCPVL